MKKSPLVAVVTGGASGIGRSLASKCLKEGMCVVIADIEEEALKSTVNQFKQIYGESKIHATVVDVSKLSDIQRLAVEVMERFGKINFLFNNAGVSSGMSTYKSNINDWIWMTNVNLFGVVYSLKVFVPLMLQQTKEETMHIINTASLCGLLSGSSYSSVYTTTKHAVVALTEGLAYELSGSSIKVHVLIPGAVSTNIYNAERNRPPELLDQRTEEVKKEYSTYVDITKKMFANTMHPDIAAEKTFDGISQNHFYLFTHPQGSLEGIRERFKDILENRQPTKVPIAGL